MSSPCQISVVLSTFNRAHLLGPAIARLKQQAPSAPPYELIVVDNASTDGTAEIVTQHAAGDSSRPVRYIYEPRQGLSYARNAGIAAASAPIVAFTDDDVRVSEGWVEAIKHTFDAFVDVECVGGRTLPLWPHTPPSWLTQRPGVGPLALQDYGDQPFAVEAQRPLCLAGCNFAFRRSVFAKIGLFSLEFPRAQDTQFVIRMLRAGGRAMYVPGMLVHAPVDTERLTKAYHRRWHRNVGRCNARMGFEELSDPVVGIRTSAPAVRRVCGVPLFALRQFGAEFALWLTNAIKGRKPEAFLHETRLHALAGYAFESYALRRRSAAAARQAASGPEFSDAAATRPVKFEI
jgi:glycosyltransferase involved in cell wall biosynthesis